MHSIRAVEEKDHAVICDHRRRMFADNDISDETLDAMAAPLAAWLKPRLKDGRYFGFVAEDEGAIIAGIGLMLVDWPPHFLHPESDVRGYIMNVFVEPEYRGRRIADELMVKAEDAFRERGVVYEVLHASRFGRPVYEKLGWNSTTEMAKTLA